MLLRVVVLESVFRARIRHAPFLLYHRTTFDSPEISHAGCGKHARPRSCGLLMPSLLSLLIPQSLARGCGVFFAPGGPRDPVDSNGRKGINDRCESCSKHRYLVGNKRDPRQVGCERNGKNVQRRKIHTQPHKLEKEEASALLLLRQTTKHARVRPSHGSRRSIASQLQHQSSGA